MTTPTITDEQIAELERDAIARNSLKRGQCEGGHKLHSAYACGVCGAGPQDGCRRPLPDSYNNPPIVLALISRLRAAERDAERLDKLDAIGHAYGFEDMHEGNRWMVDGPYRDVRAAIDGIPEDAMSQPEPNHPA